jgi:hypothetical protein
MNRRTERTRRWRIWLLAPIACLGSALAIVAWQGSAAAAPDKPFSVVICAPGQSCKPGSPPVVSPGATSSTPAALTAVLKDESTKGSGQKLGSANLTPPSGVTVVSASLGGTAIGPCSATTPATTSCITSAGVLELRSLNVDPGASIQVSIGVATPPPPSSCTTATPCQWSVSAKQSNEYSGTGNNLNLDLDSSQLGIVLSSQVTCTSAQQSNTCSATLADGGTTGSTGGSVSITTDATGTSGGTLFEAIDFGPHLNPATECSGIDSAHDEYVSGAALNGQNQRSFTVTINTTAYPGYRDSLCVTTSQPFTAKFISASGTVTVGPAVPVTQPDGTPGFAGLLPNCAGDGAAPTVDCSTQPGVVSRSLTAGVHTLVASFPAGFDASMRN